MRRLFLLQHLGKVESKGEDQDDNEDEEVYHEDEEDALEFESDGVSSNGEESDEDNELYDDDMYGHKRPNMEDESIKLTQEQKKVVEDLRKKHKKYVFMIILLDFLSNVSYVKS